MRPQAAQHYNYFRDYDPAIGRYIHSDPIGLAGGANTFAYVMGNPLVKLDWLGLVPEHKDPNPYPVLVECPPAPSGMALVDKQVGKAKIKRCFPLFNPKTGKAEMDCIGEGDFGYECVVECVYVRVCDGKGERRTPGICLRGPKQKNT